MKKSGDAASPRFINFSRCYYGRLQGAELTQKLFALFSKPNSSENTFTFPFRGLRGKRL